MFCRIDFVASGLQVVLMLFGGGGAQGVRTHGGERRCENLCVADAEAIPEIRESSFHMRLCLGEQSPFGGRGRRCWIVCDVRWSYLSHAQPVGLTLATMSPHSCPKSKTDRKYTLELVSCSAISSFQCRSRYKILKLRFIHYLQKIFNLKPRPNQSITP